MKKPTLKIEITVTSDGEKAISLECGITRENMEIASIRTKTFFALLEQSISSKKFLKREVKKANIASGAVEMLETLIDTAECDCPECQDENENRTDNSNDIVIH